MLKRWFVATLVALSLLVSSVPTYAKDSSHNSKPKTVHVKTYKKKSGTKVKEYNRKPPKTRKTSKSTTQ